jgi:hypothetical protein
MGAPTMNNAEAIQMMERCKHEIRELRGVVDRLRPKAEAYDNLAAVLRLLPQPGIGMSEDMVWVLDKRIQELQPKPEPGLPVGGD